MSKIKLLIMFPSNIRGGAEEYALTIAKAAVKEQWKVHAAFPNIETTHSLIEDFKKQSIEYHPLDIAPVDGKRGKLFREHIPQFFRTVFLIIKIKPDIVHLNIPWYNWAFDSLLACGFLKTPTLVVFHLFPNKVTYNQLKLQAYKWAFNRNQKWIAISENNRQFISQSFQIDKNQISLIYNGTKANSNLTDITEQQVSKLRNQLRQELHLPDNSKILLTVGRLHSQKGYKDLIEVIGSIIEKFPEVKFVWVGEGNLRDYLEKKINSYGLEKEVILLGYRTDVPFLLKASDLLVFPTWFEGGQSFVISEAMAHGLPIVASNASGIPEIIENKVHGLLFTSKNQQELLEGILWALNHPEAMKEMAKNAQQRVQGFSEDKMIEKTFEMIKIMKENSLRN